MSQQSGPQDAALMSEDHLDFLTVPERLKLTQYLTRIQVSPTKKDEITKDLTEDERIKLDKLAAAIQSGGRNANQNSAVAAPPDAKPIMPAFQQTNEKKAVAAPPAEGAQMEGDERNHRKGCCILI